MAAIVVPVDGGVKRESDITATTVKLYTLPPGTEWVMVASEPGGSAMEVAWEGTDGGASSDADFLLLLSGDATMWMKVPSGLYAPTATRQLRLRLQSAVSTAYTIITTKGR